MQLRCSQNSHFFNTSIREIYVSRLSMSREEMATITVCLHKLGFIAIYRIYRIKFSFWTGFLKHILASHKFESFV